MEMEQSQVDVASLHEKIRQLENENLLLTRDNNQLEADLSDTKEMLVKHQNDSICRMQESRRFKSIIKKLKKLFFRYSNIKDNDFILHWPYQTPC